jgi:hypothetical protein
MTMSSSSAREGTEASSSWCGGIGASEENRRNGKRDSLSRFSPLALDGGREAGRGERAYASPGCREKKRRKRRRKWKKRKSDSCSFGENDVLFSFDLDLSLEGKKKYQHVPLASSSPSLYLVPPATKATVLISIM